MKWPFVSIIIPTLNEEKYIEHTLKSLSNQDYKGKYEIIVVDSSRDKTPQIAKKYASKVINVTKIGPAAARNAGANNAKGNILLFIDSDTILLPNTLNDLIIPFKDKKIVASTCLLLPLSNKFHDFLGFFLANEYIKFSIMQKNAQIPGACIVCRHDAYKKVNGFNEEILTDDIDFSKRLNKIGKIVYIDNNFVLTSIRRFEKLGRFNTTGKYISAHLRFLLGRPQKSMDYETVR